MKHTLKTNDQRRVSKNVPNVKENESYKDMSPCKIKKLAVQQREDTLKIFTSAVLGLDVVAKG